MRYKLLGHSGLRVSELCLGTMTFGETWGWGAFKTECKKMFDRFAEVGGNFIDTSVNYTDGENETILGDLLKADRDHFVVATKYTLTKPDDSDPNGGGNSRKNMRKSLERSLKRLQTDHIDLYYLHMWDYMTPVEAVVHGLDDLVKQGKVNYVAFSDTPAWIVAEANARAELMGWSRFVGMQVPYSLLNRAVERAILPMARHWDMAVMPWGLLNAGILTGKFLKEVSDPTRIDHEKLDLSEKAISIVLEVQKNLGGSRSADVTGSHQLDTPTAEQGANDPHSGARTVEQLQENLSVLEWQLSDEQLKHLDKASAIEMGFPHGFLEGNRYIFGATFDQIDNHRI